MIRRLAAWVRYWRRNRTAVVIAVAWTVDYWSIRGRQAAERVFREDPPMKRWSATILIETDDEQAAIDAGRAAHQAAGAVLGAHMVPGHVAVSELMPETAIP